MKSGPAPAAVDRGESPARIFALALGAFLGLTLLKFGNPPIFESWVTPPKDIYEFLLGNPWPIVWAYGLLVCLVVMGTVVAITRRRAAAPAWLTLLPVLWLFWECLSTASTVNSGLSRPTLAHFFGCVACFYVGLFALRGSRCLTGLLPGLLLAFLLVIAVGWQQHFGGLEQTRRFFFLYLYPRMREVPLELLKKMMSPRIFSTLFYPNALAGAILLLLPVLLEFLWQARQRFTRGARVFLVGSVGGGALACLYWSGSKGGWLLMLILGLIWLLRLPLNARLKQGVIGLVLLGGLAGFFWRYSGFFEKGATSVGARFDYWQAAARTALAHPILGTGPGTFALAYAKIKRPEWEMSRLVHNDYLEQASDSGLPGLLFYGAFVLGTLVLTAPWRRAANKGSPGSAEHGGDPRSPRGPAALESRRAPEPDSGWSGSLWFALWLGLLGWALQGLMEFSLYLPSLAWPAFVFMGLLLGRAADIAEREVTP